MIDLQTESILAVRDIPEHVPGRPHIATCWRWIYHGVRGVKLATIVVGGRRFTSKEAIERFIEASTATADRTPIPARTARERRRAIEQAERELAAAGI